MEKKEVFTDQEIQILAKRFKTLSEASRLKIVRALHSGEKCVTEIINITGLLQANVSKQLKILENDGVVTCRPAGLQRFYKISDPVVFQICQKICQSKKVN